MPALRERRQDIPLLVEYFIDRYASKAGKKIRSIHRATLERLQSYAWPGNVRELQNVIERSIIVCETDNFTVDESWLTGKPDETEQSMGLLWRMPAAQQKQTIEAALADAQGRVSGPAGAAAKLGIPASTLDSKIKVFKINKFRYKTVQALSLGRLQKITKFGNLRTREFYTSAMSYYFKSLYLWLLACHLTSQAC